MATLMRCNSNSNDFAGLVHALDADLNERYGLLQNQYNQFNVIPFIGTVVIAYLNNTPVACGCFKAYSQDAVEIKRMYVKSENRGQGIARQILRELEKWAREQGFHKAILETGKKQPEAIGLYKKSGYQQIENYGQYMGMENSVCFEKKII